MYFKVAAIHFLIFEGAAICGLLVFLYLKLRNLIINDNRALAAKIDLLSKNLKTLADFLNSK